MAETYGSSGESNIVGGSSINNGSSCSTLDGKRTSATCIIVVVVDTCIEGDASDDGSDSRRRGRGIGKLQ